MKIVSEQWRWLVWVGLASICALLIAACSPYNRIAKRNPVTPKDSLILAKICVAAFPTVPSEHDTTYVITGAEPVVPEPPKVVNIDSLLNQMDSTNRVQCSQIGSSFFDQGYYQGRLSVGVRVDTLVRERTIRELDTRTITIERARAAEANEATVKAQRRISLWQGVSIALAVGLVCVCILFGLSKKLK